MILYFSGAGNSKYVALKAAEATQDNLVSIVDCAKNQRFSFDLKKGESLGIVTPVYFSGLPTIVDEFLGKLSVNAEEKPYVYLVATCGASSGSVDVYLKRHLKRIGLELSAGFCVNMPDTWTVIFSVNNKKKINKKLHRAESKINEILLKIKNQERGSFMKLKFPMFISNIMRKTYEKARSTKHFVVASSCEGCGQCAQNCPAEAIQIQSNRPVWVKEKCVMCLGCLHTCPNFAIQYGEKTKYHGQYCHPYFKSETLKA